MTTYNRNQPPLPPHARQFTQRGVDVQQHPKGTIVVKYYRLRAKLTGSTPPVYTTWTANAYDDPSPPGYDPAVVLRSWTN